MRPGAQLRSPAAWSSLVTLTDLSLDTGNRQGLLGEAGLSRGSQAESAPTLLLIPLLRGKCVRPEVHAGQLTIPSMSGKHPHHRPAVLPRPQWTLLSSWRGARHMFTIRTHVLGATASPRTTAGPTEQGCIC